MYGFVGVEIVKELVEMTMSDAADGESQKSKKSPNLLARLAKGIRQSSSDNTAPKVCDSYPVLNPAKAGREK